MPSRGEIDGVHLLAEFDEPAIHTEDAPVNGSMGRGVRDEIGRTTEIVVELGSARTQESASSPAPDMALEVDLEAYFTGNNAALASLMNRTKQALLILLTPELLAGPGDFDLARNDVIAETLARMTRDLQTEEFSGQAFLARVRATAEAVIEERTPQETKPTTSVPSPIKPLVVRDLTAG